MRRDLLLLHLVAFGALGIAATGRVAAQEQPANSLLERIQKPGGSSLRVCLRLQDESPFLGPADVRVLPNEGYEVLGAPGESRGDFLFSEMTPGKYFVEVKSPGYLEVRLSTELEPGSRQRTMFVVMKPRPAVKQEVKGLELNPAPEVEAEPAVAIAPAGKTGGRDFWRAHELEERIPAVEKGVACPAEEVLKGAGQRMSEFVNTLEKFTATEQLEHYVYDKSGAQRDPEKRSFAYVVAVTQNQLGTFMLEEFRNGSTDPEQFPGHIASLGLPALGLIFHPVLASDFDFQCEGMGSWQGRELWQVHFVQRDDRPVRIRAYNLNMRAFGVKLEGRAWIDPGNNQVVRLETELAKPVPEIELTREHVVIDYAAVKFASTGQEVWLPENAEMYVERRGRRYHRRHAFSDFKLFNVDTAQHVDAPKGSYRFANLTDGDVSGELMVFPAEGATDEAIVLRFTIPAHQVVFKVVGPGKDVNLQAAAVRSAKFVYRGRAGAVKVDADLSAATTLDVMPEGAEEK
jgi:hypothetical protein